MHAQFIRGPSARHSPWMYPLRQCLSREGDENEIMFIVTVMLRAHLLCSVQCGTRRGISMAGNPLVEARARRFFSTLFSVLHLPVTAPLAPSCFWRAGVKARQRRQTGRIERELKNRVLVLHKLEARTRASEVEILGYSGRLLWCP